MGEIDHHVGSFGGGQVETAFRHVQNDDVLFVLLVAHGGVNDHSRIGQNAAIVGDLNESRTAGGRIGHAAGAVVQNVGGVAGGGCSPDGRKGNAGVDIGHHHAHLGIAGVDLSCGCGLQATGDGRRINGDSGRVGITAARNDEFDSGDGSIGSDDGRGESALTAATGDGDIGGKSGVVTASRHCHDDIGDNRTGSVELEIEETVAGGINQLQAVCGRLNIEVGIGLTVDHRSVVKGLRHMGNAGRIRIANVPRRPLPRAVIPATKGIHTAQVRIVRPLVGYINVRKPQTARRRCQTRHAVHSVGQPVGILVGESDGVGHKSLVLKHQLDVVIEIIGQRGAGCQNSGNTQIGQRGFFRRIHQEIRCQLAGIHVRPSHAVGMVMIPEQPSALQVGPIIGHRAVARIGHVRRVQRINPLVVGGFLPGRGDPLMRVTIARPRIKPAVQVEVGPVLSVLLVQLDLVGDRPDLDGTVTRAGNGGVQRDEGAAGGAGREQVAEFHAHRLAFVGDDHRAGIVGLVNPVNGLAGLIGHVHGEAMGLVQRDGARKGGGHDLHIAAQLGATSRKVLVHALEIFHQADFVVIAPGVRRSVRSAGDGDRNILSEAVGVGRSEPGEFVDKLAQRRAEGVVRFGIVHPGGQDQLSARFVRRAGKSERG